MARDLRHRWIYNPCRISKWIGDQRDTGPLSISRDWCTVDSDGRRLAQSAARTGSPSSAMDRDAPDGQLYVGLVAVRGFTSLLPAVPGLVFSVKLSDFMAAGTILMSWFQPHAFTKQVSCSPDRRAIQAIWQEVDGFDLV